MPRVIAYQCVRLHQHAAIARGVGDADARQRLKGGIGWCRQRIEEESEAGHAAERHSGAIAVITVVDRHEAHGIARTDLTQLTGNEPAVGKAKTVADGLPALGGLTDDERVRVRNVLNRPDGAAVKVEPERLRRESRLVER